MSKAKKQQKYCNCQTSTDKAILNEKVDYSFCQKCGCVLLKSQEGAIYYTLKSKQKRQPYDLSPIELIKHMKKKTEEEFPYIYEEFNVNKNDKHIKDKSVKSINVYLKYRKMILSKLQKLIKTFDYCDMSFYQTLFFLDAYFSHKISEDMSEKIILYYLIGYFLCAVKFKETDIYEPTLDSFFDLSKGIYFSIDKIAYYEVVCLRSINFNVFAYSAYDWVSQLISNGIVFNCEVNNKTEVILIKGHRHSLLNTINKYAIKLLLHLTNKNLFFKYSPMHIAMSLIQITREKFIDKTLIKPKLFSKLINLYGVNQKDYEKCYEEIKSDIKESNLENDKEKEKESIIIDEPDEHKDDLKADKRNESANKSFMKNKNIYVPNKLRSSNALIQLKGNINLITNPRYETNSPNNNNKNDSNNEDSKEKEDKKDETEISLSLNDTVSSNKKYKIRNQKNTIGKNPAERLSIDCNAKNVFRSDKNIPHLKVNQSGRYTLMTINNDEPVEKNILKNLSLSKKKNKPLLKELNHVKVNQVRYNSFKSKEKNANSSFATSVERDSEIEKEERKPKTKKKSKFFPSSNKLIQISKDSDQLNSNKINSRTSRNLPIITDFDNMNIGKTDVFIGEQNNDNKNESNNNHHHHHHHKTKRHYKLKTNIDNTEIKAENDKEVPKTKKLVEVL